MEKIKSIQLLQKFMIAFMVSIVLGLASRLAENVIPATLNLILLWGRLLLSFVTYIFLWISVNRSRQLQLHAASKYLLLTILLTTLTIVVTIGISLWSNMVMTEVLQTVTFDTTSIEAAVELGDILAASKPMQMLNVLQLGIFVIANIIYLGLAVMIFVQNKEDLTVYTKEHHDAYNS